MWESTLVLRWSWHIDDTYCIRTVVAHTRKPVHVTIFSICSCSMVLFGSFNYSLNYQSISTPLMATYVTVPYSMIPLPKKNIVLNIALALTCLILLPHSDVPLQITPQPYVVPHQMSGPSWGKRGLVQSSQQWQTSQTKFWIYFCMEVAITMSHNAKKRLSHMKMEAIHGVVLYINGKTWWSIIRFDVCW